MTNKITDNNQLPKNPKNPSLNPVSTNSEFDFSFDVTKISLLAVSLLAILGIFLFGFSGVPAILDNTSDAQLARSQSTASVKATADKKKADELIKQESSKLTFVDKKAMMKIANYGDLEIKLLDKIAPKSVENFIRLTDRKFYDNKIVHRIVKQPTFTVLQGGQAVGQDPKTSADGTTVMDELWEVAPDQVQDQQTGTFTVKNTPKFKSTEYYKDYIAEKGLVTYPKGTILMAKTKEANSATTEFFISLADTTLPAQYTVFGIVNPNNFGVLDKINAEVGVEATVTSQGQADPTDGKPNKEIKFTSVTIE